MRVIVEHTEDAELYLRQYASILDSWGPSYKALEIEEKYLPWLKQIVCTIESSFTIQLAPIEERLTRKSLAHNSILLAVVEAKAKASEADGFYNMSSHTYSQIKPQQTDSGFLWISCYGESDQVTAVDYIKCMVYLTDLAGRRHQSMLIYTNSDSLRGNDSSKSLMYKMIDTYLRPSNSCLIMRSIQEDGYSYHRGQHIGDSSYLEHITFTQDNLQETVKKQGLFLESLNPRKGSKKISQDGRQTAPLYEDVFYRSIEPGEAIYIILSVGSFRKPEYYEALGITTVRLLGDYSVLYGTKGQLEAIGNVLRLEIGPEYPLAVMAYPECIKMGNIKKSPGSLMPQNLAHKGTGVYIGIITTEFVDYTSEVLRRPDGTTRIDCLWEQVWADDGTYYFQDQINEALTETNPGVSVPLPEGDSISTMLFGIAGGESAQAAYSGIATEAEFIAAKIRRASDNIQRIYGGKPVRQGATLPDVMIGVKKLIEYATQQKRPLVLCIPFNTNIDAHDGSLVLQRILGEIARTPGITIIVPTGEEADKMHHYSVDGRVASLGPIDLRVTQEGQNVIGVMYQRYPTLLSAMLYPPEGTIGEPVNLQQRSISRIREATIYTNGESTDFLNGARRIRFRIDRPQMGIWRIEGRLREDINSTISLWLSQQEFNPYTTLSPSNPLVTAGALACVNNMMSVGGYNQEGMVVLRSSGRGYTWDNRITPLFVTHANQITAPCGHGEWAQVTGTVPAVSIMAGVVARLYSKALAEGVFPLPNTLIMSSMILSQLTQFEELTYPNPSQGYGIFDLRAIEVLLTTAYQV